MNLTENLKKIRKENGLSQEQLADKLGVSRQSVSKWESGTAYPEMDKMIKLCQLFDLNIDELLNQNIEKVNDIKESKNTINKYIDDFLGYITKTVNMFSSMKFKQKIKCLFEQVVIICILLIIFTIIGSIFSNFINRLLNIIPLPNVHIIISNILEGIYGIIAFVLGAILVLHIFKVRYLDYYVVIDKKENDDVEDNKDNKEYLEKKEERIIIRDPKHSSYKFMSGLLKFLLGCIKLFVIFISIFFCFSLICLSMSLILSFVIVKTGLLFVGTIIGILGCIIFNIIILYIMYNFVINKKNNYRMIGLGLLLSFILVGMGVGFGFLGFKEFDVIPTDDGEYFIKNDYNILMKDNLFINEYYDISYIESDSDDIKIEVIHSKYTDFEILNNDYIDFDYYDSYDNVMDILKSQIEAFNDKKIYDIYKFKVNVYASSDNIKKIQENRREYYQKIDY